ncbi:MULTISPECIES: hypothetical protein [Gordonia]|nr:MULTISPECIES: hypothetical protein [Gordonia]NKY95783.1 hypothetical protein [Gordonia sputi]
MGFSVVGSGLDGLDQRVWLDQRVGSTGGRGSAGEVGGLDKLDQRE